MKASLIVKTAQGRIVAIGPEIHIDEDSVAAERARLRSFYGPAAVICEQQVAYAREAMEQRAVA